MRILIRFLILVAVLWSAWWWLAASVIDRGANAWLSDRRAEGWQAETGAIATAGFPFKLKAEIADLTLATPKTGVALHWDRATVSAPIYWPGYVTLALPNTPIELGTSEAKHQIRVQDGHARLYLHPSPSLQLGYFEARSGAWQLDTPKGRLMAGDDWSMQVIQDAEVSEKYQFHLQLADLRPGDFFRAELAVPAEWPLVFDQFAADLVVTFDRAWDRRAIKAARPQPRMINLRHAKAAWGPIQLTATADLTMNDQGIPDGTAQAMIENWADLLDLAVAGGVVPADIRPQAQAMLGALANMGGDPARLDLTLRFTGNEMYLGPIRLGPAPRIVLR